MRPAGNQTESPEARAALRMYHVPFFLTFGLLQFTAVCLVSYLNSSTRAVEVRGPSESSLRLRYKFNGHRPCCNSVCRELALLWLTHAKYQRSSPMRKYLRSLLTRILASQ
jgi:hypothetical protein